MEKQLEFTFWESTLGTPNVDYIPRKIELEKTSKKQQKIINGNTKHIGSADSPNR